MYSQFCVSGNREAGGEREKDGKGRSMEQSEHRCFLAKFAILCECGVWCPKTIKNSNIKDRDHRSS